MSEEELPITAAQVASDTTFEDTVRDYSTAVGVYTDAPQDPDYDAAKFATFKFPLEVTATPRYLDQTVDEAIAFLRREMEHPSQSWYNLCQSLQRHAYDVDAWAPSALDAWYRIPLAHRHTGSSTRECPRGGLMYFGGTRFGHVMMAIEIGRAHV